MRPEDWILLEQSDSLRSELGLKNHQKFDVIDALRKLNVETLFRGLSENFSGLSIRTKDLRFMLVNSNQPIGRQNFTVCHELYHLLFQPDTFSHQCKINSSSYKTKEEKNADTFASIVLMPEVGIVSLISNRNELKRDAISVDTVVRLEQFFEVSHLAMLVRLKALGLITETLLEAYRNDVTRLALSLGYSDELYKSGRHNLTVGNYHNLAEELYKNGLISKSHYYEILTVISNEEEPEKELST